MTFLLKGGESVVFHLCRVIVTVIEATWDVSAPGCVTAVITIVEVTENKV